MAKINAENWDLIRWPNFHPPEFFCPQTGQCAMDADFLDALQALRTVFGRPLVISSGYRSPTHPLEAGKSRAGSHALGCAVDVRLAGPDAYRLVALATSAAFAGIMFAGIGVKQHGAAARRFVHLDSSPPRALAPRPALWSYADADK